MAVIGARRARTMPLGLGRPGRSGSPRTGARTTALPHRAASRRRRDSEGVSGFLLAIAAAACLALFYLSQSTHVAATGYQIDALEAELSRGRSANQQLILDIAAARSPAAIERAAERLGLRELDEGRITFAVPSSSPAAVPPD